MASRIVTIERLFTETEIAAKGTELAVIQQEIGQLVIEKKSNADLFKAQISEKTTAAEAIGKSIRRRGEMTDVECEMFINKPQPGQKTYISVKTGLAVKVMDMEDSDKQSKLFEVDTRPDPAEPEVQGPPPEMPLDPVSANDEFAEFMKGLEPTTEEVPDRSHENKPKGGRRGRPAGSKNKPKDGEDHAPGPNEEEGPHGQTEDEENDDDSVPL